MVVREQAAAEVRGSKALHEKRVDSTSLKEGDDAGGAEGGVCGGGDWGG